MNKQEAKIYILKHWKVSSGKKITEMLKRYWGLKKDIAAEAERIFNG